MGSKTVVAFHAIADCEMNCKRPLAWSSCSTAGSELIASRKSGSEWSQAYVGVVFFEHRVGVEDAIAFAPASRVRTKKDKSRLIRSLPHKSSKEALVCARPRVCRGGAGRGGLARASA